jgi:hypothetical protein
MVRVITPGLDQYTNGPHGNDWYKTTTITCPRCGCTFRLDEPDFVVGGPFVGSDLGQHYHWDKTDKFFNPLATTVLYPDGISGQCPWCDYYPIQVLFIDAGLSHPASVGDPAFGNLQDYIVNHAIAKVTFWRATGTGQLIALLLIADGSPYYGGDATHQSQIAVTRSGATSFTVPVIFFYGTDATPVDPGSARRSDPDFCALFDRLNVTII